MLSLTIFILKKIAVAIVLLLLISLFVFSALSLVPGDPALQLLGQSWTPEGGEALRENLGLNDPILVQYGRFVWNALHGDLGRSYMTVLPVFRELTRAVGLSLQLTSMAIVLSLLVGIPLGVAAAIWRNSWIDVVSRSFTILLSSVPTFVLGITLIYIFAAKLKWLPSGGVGGLRHMFLPALTMSLFATAGIMRMTRANFLEVLRQDYIRAARSRGLAFHKIIFSHALRNVAIPLLTLGGLYIGLMIGTAVITEYVFAWPGLGTLTIAAIQSRDVPMIQGGILATALIYVTLNSLTDIGYGLIDPRLRIR